MQKLLLVYYHSENRSTSQIWKILPNMVFPPIWGEKMAAFWACACKLSWTLLSPTRVQPLYGAGRKESPGTGLCTSKLLIWRQKLTAGVLHGTSLVVRRVWSGMIIVVLFWTKYAFPRQIKPGIFKLTTCRGHINLLTVFSFVNCKEKGCYR